MPNMHVQNTRKTPATKTQTDEPTMQTKMGPGIQTRMEMPKQKLHTRIQYGKKLQKHNQYHCHPKKNNDKTEEDIAQNLRKPDRRKQLQEGLPTEKKLMYGNKAAYDPEQKIRKCQICPKTFQKNSMGNIILHACRHTTMQKKLNMPTWTQLNPTQLQIRDSRIRTLQRPHTTQNKPHHETSTHRQNDTINESPEHLQKQQDKPQAHLQTKHK